MTNQSTIDQANSEFWNELCGSSLARELGISVRDDTSIARFDAAYLEMYPYLLERVPVDKFSRLRVLEVGLGYGTLGQQIASKCGEYIGFDIAEGPIEMMTYRLTRLLRANGRAQQGSVLDCPFPDESFDVVVAIGCYHHTGNLQRAIDETYRVLKAGGTAYIMVYNALSYRTGCAGRSAPRGPR